MPTIKILLTGNGKVAYGAKEMLDAMKIRQVSVAEYLHNHLKNPYIVWQMFWIITNAKIYQVLDNIDFYKHPENYESDFMRFASGNRFFYCGSFLWEWSSLFYLQEKMQIQEFKIQFVADISCDVNGPVASTLRASTIAAPLYGYHPATESEVDYKDKEAIVVMAVDNLPCELPKDASEGFGELFLKNVIPAFFNNDEEGVLQRAKMTEKGKLTKRFSYLQAYVDGKE